MGQQRWYLMAKNPWEDRIRIMHWENGMALSTGILSACSAAHVRELLVRWLDAEFSAPSQQNLPPIFALEQTDLDASPAWALATRVQPIGELAIHRGALHESPSTLTSVLDAISHTLQNASADSEIFGHQDTSAYAPCVPQMAVRARSASV